MKDSYIDYAMSVIVGRALPDVRDGLKPVHRRILIRNERTGRNTGQASYKKSARIVGEVMGKYHPHGDSSIYDAMVRLAQPFSHKIHAGGRPRKLRFRRRSRRSCHALYRGEDDASGPADAAGH